LSRLLQRLLLPIAASVAIGSSFSAAPAAAAGPPSIDSSSVEGVAADAATLRAKINPNGFPTTYRFEYLTEAAYQANLAIGPPRSPFQGAALAPSTGTGGVGTGTTPVTVTQSLTGLSPETAYRYRVVAQNAAETVFGTPRPFGTQAATNVFSLLDHRGWEMVSPIAKNGGAVQAPGTIAGGGTFQAGAAGDSIAYSSLDSFSAEAQGALGASQYVSRLAGSGWSTEDITTPLLGGSYGDSPDGVPYQLFSPGLSLALLSNGERCRGDAGGECPVANPPLPGSGAPAGYRDYYRRHSDGSFESLLEQSDLLHTTLSSSQFEMRLAGSSADLSHVVVSSCAALAVNATETAAPGGCDPAAQNLYEWSGGALTTINLLPGDTTATPGAELAAPSGAISADGSRVYWTEGGNLYLREGAQTKQVDAASSGGGEFQVASSEGEIAYFTAGGNLFRFTAASGAAVQLTTDGEVEGVLGASADGTRVYYADAGAVLFAEGAATTPIAAGAADPANFPPGTGAGAAGEARVTADGKHLLFVSSEELTGFQNAAQPEAFLYGSATVGGPPTLTCVSCSPFGQLPGGPASLPGARVNGTSADATRAYRPRSLSADGTRVFFESPDALSPQDNNNGQVDVYEWEAQGAGTCARAGGCVQLISSGHSSTASTFLDADEDGSDAYFLTQESIYPLDPGSYDVYVARVGGGFSLPPNEIPCNGDACQSLPEAPEDPTPGTLVPNGGNPPLTIAGSGSKPKKKHHKKRHGGKKKHGGKAKRSNRGGAR